MLIRILKMRVNLARYEDWLTFTRDTGFPGMLAQPGCRAIRRLRRVGSDEDFRVLTEWDDMAALERFRASPAMGELTRAAAGLTIPPAEELLLEVIPDPV